MELNRSVLKSRTAYQEIVPVSQVKIFAFKKPEVLPWTSPKFLSLIFYRAGVAFIFLSFKGCSWIAHWTFPEKWKMQIFSLRGAPSLNSFFDLVSWLHRYLTHLCSQDDGCDAPRICFSSQQWKILANWHWLLTAILIMISFLQNPHTDHLALLGSAAHYLVSNVNLPNIHSCQWHVVPFQSVHWSGTPALPGFSLAQHHSKLQNTAPLQQSWVLAAGAPAEKALNGTAKSRLPPASPWR